MGSVRKVIRKKKMKIRQKNVEPTLTDIMNALTDFRKEFLEGLEKLEEITEQVRLLSLDMEGLVELSKKSYI